LYFHEKVVTDLSECVTRPEVHISSVIQSNVDSSSDKVGSHELPEVSKSLTRFPEADSNVLISHRLSEASKALVRSPDKWT